MRYKLRRAARIWRNQGPSVVVRKAANYAPIEVANLFYRIKLGAPTRVMSEDWDTLVMLDACRFDLFRDRNWLDGFLDYRVSLGSTSEEFLERNFAGETFHDTVYVNANPYVPQLNLDDGRFHAVIDLLEEWDEDLQTVLPETVADAAIEAHREFPNKRHIVHFMQPHVPFIGETGRELGMQGWPTELDGSLDGETIWQHLREHPPDSEAGLDLDTVWTAYRENLDIALDQVERLLDHVDGLTVVTSDHGNLVGERLWPIPTKRMYGHPLGVYHPNLVKVPWFRVETGDRRTVVEEEPLRGDAVDEAVIEDRLRALGYR
jgi:hypothetical protein